jgi:hypothetical protein
MNTKKIIYISHSHLTSKVRNDYFIDHLLSKKWNVEYWNLLPLLYGEIDEYGMQDADFLYIPKSYANIREKLSSPLNRDAIFVVLINFGPQYLSLYRLLAKYNCKTHFFAWGSYPYTSSNLNWKNILNHFLSPYSLLKNTLNLLNGSVQKKLKLVKPYDVVYGAGSEILESFQDASKLISVNTIDYDNYVEVKKKSGRIIPYSYAVFLDINLPYQSDLIIHNMPKMAANEYYESLNKFFDLLEKKYNVKLVIAAHPKANYQKTLFNGREIFHGLTPEVVSDSDFVVSHHSTSVSYAVLNLKPIIFVYTSILEEIYKKLIVDRIIDFADFLDCNFYNIDKIDNEEHIIINEVNSDCYEDYKYRFLTSKKSENTTMKDLFWHEINLD